MKYTVFEKQWEYFRNEHFIEFENILSKEELARLIGEIESVLCERLKVEKPLVYRQHPAKLFEVGRDMWRANSAVKKIAVLRRFAEIAVQLIDVKPLRLGYDQLLVKSQLQSPALPGGNPCPGFLQTAASLKEISCIQGIACGWLLCLSGETSGNAVFFHSEAFLDFPRLADLEHHAHYLVVYTRVKSVYILNRRDPNVRSLMKLGYNFGDRLIEEKNPIIFR